MTTRAKTKSAESIRVRINIKPLAEKVGIEKPHHLWQAFGGSKSTAISLWDGNIIGINFDTMERLLAIFRKGDPVMYRSIAGHLNASGLFVVEEGGEVVGPTKTARSQSPAKARGSKGTGATRQ